MFDFGAFHAGILILARADGPVESSMPTRVMFAGPTLFGNANRSLATAAGFAILPPIARGDLPKLLDTTEPGLLVIVDGRFHQSLAVGHREIRDAIERGWDVWGLASMGAIRAFEMRSCGMRGFGDVFARFVDEDDFQDDEVALLHLPIAPYEPVTEPLVHIRCALRFLTSDEIISPSEELELIDPLKSQWYGTRTLDAVDGLLVTQLGNDRAARARFQLADFDRFRVKSNDLRSFLDQKPWAKG